MITENTKLIDYELLRVAIGKINELIESINSGAFGNIKVGNVTLLADSNTSFELVPGDGITLTPDAETNKITISSKEYTFQIKEDGNLYVSY